MKFLITLFVLALVCGVAQAQNRRDSINVLGYVSGLAVTFQQTNSYLGFGVANLPFDNEAPCAGAPDNTIKIVPSGGSFEANPYLIVCEGGSPQSLSVANPDYVINGVCPDNYHQGTVFDAANFFRSDGANAGIRVRVVGVTQYACRATTNVNDFPPDVVDLTLTPSGYGSEQYGLTSASGWDGYLCVSNTAPIQYFATNNPCTNGVNYDVNDFCDSQGLVGATTQDIVNQFTAGFTAEYAIRNLILRQDILRDIASLQYSGCASSSGYEYSAYNLPVQFIQTATSCPFDVNIPLVSSNSANNIDVDSVFILQPYTGNITLYSYTGYGCTSQVTALNNKPVWTASRLTLLEKGPDFNAEITNTFDDENAYFYSSPVLACKFRADLNYLPANPPSCTDEVPASEFYCVAKDSSYCPCDSAYCTSTGCSRPCCSEFCNCCVP